MNWNKFQMRSLKTRVTLVALGIILIGIWSQVVYVNQILYKDMQRVLGEQQFSTVSLIAAEINTGLEERMRALEHAALMITPAILGNASSAQTFIERLPALAMMFNGGIFMLQHDGTAVADFPLSTGRRGLNFLDRKYASGALKDGKTTIGDPVMGKALRSMLFSIAVPIHNAKGNVIGALSGTIDLAKTNFLSRITDNSYGKMGGYLVIAPKIRTIVFASDKKRILEALPAPGINPLIDRFVQGYEGTAVIVNPLGDEVLVSAKGIPVSGWYVVASLPTAEAFSPISAMQQRMLFATILLTLLAGGLTWWILKHQLAPMFTAVKMLAAFSKTDQTPQYLPIVSQDEIGELIGAFNRLLRTLGERENEIRENESKYRNLVEQAGDGFELLDTAGKYIDVNESTCRMLGYTRDEMLRLGVTDIDPRKSHAQFVSEFKSMIGASPVTFETVHRRKDGTEFPVEVTASIINIKNEELAQVFTRDITERKQAEEALKESREQFRTVVEKSPFSMALVNMRGDIEYLNHKAIETFGYFPQDIPNMARWWEQAYPDKTYRDQVIKQWMDLVNEAFVHKHEIDKHEYRVTCKDGTVKTVVIFGVWIGEKVLVVFDDVTERKLLEEQSLRAQKLESIGTLAGGIAHDFNNLLQGVFGYISLAKMTISDKANSIASLEHAEKALHQTVNLTNQLLTFSKGGRPSKKVIDLRPLIENSAKFMLSGSRSDFRLNIPKDLWHAEADEGQIGQVFQNIVLNADQSMPMGGTVNITASNLAKSDEALPPGLDKDDYILITVQDTGVGIPEQYLSKIFDPYFTTKEKGSGLGLATSYSNMKNHGGMIDVKTKSGGGSSFMIYIPAAARLARQESPETPHRVSTSRKLRILVMDDDEVIRKISRKLIGALGHDVEVAEHGPAALEKYQSANISGHPFDIVILDLTIRGGMGGVETIQELLKVDPKVKAIVSSGYSDDMAAVNYLSQGFKASLKKPYDVDALKNAIHAMLDIE